MNIFFASALVLSKNIPFNCMIFFRFPLVFQPGLLLLFFCLVFWRLSTAQSSTKYLSFSKFLFLYFRLWSLTFFHSEMLCLFYHVFVLVAWFLSVESAPLEDIFWILKFLCSFFLNLYFRHRVKGLLDMISLGREMKWRTLIVSAK